MGFTQSSFAHLLLRQHSSSVWEEREGELYFPASLPQTLAAESPVRHRSDLEAAGLADVRPANLESPAQERIPPAFYFFARITVHRDFCAYSTSFYCHHFPRGQHNPQICYFGYSRIPLGMPSMTKLLQSRDPRGRYCANSYRHCWEQQCVPQPANTHACLFPGRLADEGRTADFSALANPTIACFVLFTFFGPLHVLNRINKWSFPFKLC